MTNARVRADRPIAFDVIRIGESVFAAGRFEIYRDAGIVGLLNFKVGFMGLSLQNSGLTKSIIR